MDHYYKYVRWLSLDIVLGAICFLRYLEKFYQVPIHFSTYFGLGSAIWLIYTADHLLDAFKTNEPSTDRHRFHKKHFHALVFMAGFVLILSLVNLWLLDVRIIRSGAMLTAVSVAYLMLVYFVKRLWIKEVLVAMVYATGVFLAPLNYVNIQLIDILLILELAGIALLNLLVFSFLDYETDRKDGFASIVIQMGKVRVNKVIVFLTVAILLGVTLLLITTTHPIQLMYGAMGLILGMIHFWPAPFLKEERYRTIGDGIFYLPALFLLL